MEMLNIKINGKDYTVEKNTTILQADPDLVLPEGYQ